MAPVAFRTRGRGEVPWPRVAMAMFLVLCSGFGLTDGQMRTAAKHRYCKTPNNPNPNSNDLYYAILVQRFEDQCMRTDNNLYGACADPNFCMCQDGADNFVRGTQARDYCEFLLQDTTDSWKYPFRGKMPNPPDPWTPAQLDYRCAAYTYCLAFIPNPLIPGGAAAPGMTLPTDPDPGGGNQNWFKTFFRFTTFNDFLRLTTTDDELRGNVLAYSHKVTKRLRKEITNRLQYTDQTIAQEGITFCIVGRHWKRSPLAQMPSLSGFLPLVEKSFDIGNHIDPDNPNLMNRFDLSENHKNFFASLRPATTFYDDQDDTTRNWNKNNARGIPRHEYENVFMGFTSFSQKNPNFAVIEDWKLTIDGWMKRPAHLDFQPGPNCRNPYQVQVTTIEADGKALHNYLHIKVFSEDVGNPTGQRCPTGKMKLLMLEVRDEQGYPVGEFTDEIPCDKDEATLNSQLKCAGTGECRRWTGTKENQVPCMFTHPESTVHPSIFMVSAPDMLGSGGGAGGGGNNVGPGGGGGGGPNVNQGPGGQTAGFCRDSANPPTPVPEVQTNDNYFTEIHATWRFAQMNNRWTKELHFATMIIEDDTPIQYYTSRKTMWQGPDTPNDTPCAHIKNPPKTGSDTGVPTTADRFRPIQTCPTAFTCRWHCDQITNAGVNTVYWQRIHKMVPWGTGWWFDTNHWDGAGGWCCRRLEKNRFNCDARCDPEYGLPRIVYDDLNSCFYWLPFQSTFSRRGVYHLALLNRCVDENDNTNRPYGYSAKYTVLQPTFKTMGGWDNLQKRYIPPENMNCHVDLTAGDLYDFDSAIHGQVTVRGSLKDYLDNEYRLHETARYKNEKELGSPPSPDELRANPYAGYTGFHGNFDVRRHRELNYCAGRTFVGLDRVPNIYELSDWHSIGVSMSQSTPDRDQMLQFTYFGRTAQIAAKKMFQSAHQDPIILKAEFPDHPVREYFGSEHLLCPVPPPNPGAPRCPETQMNGDLQRAFGSEQNNSLEQMADRSRCPCPFIPTTPPPELQTKTDVEIDGRQLHVINTLFAWMVLVPMAFFVARFYKETFSKVFFMQEFWWYTIHVLTLLTALLFTFGGIYGMKIKRDSDYVLVWTNATTVHIYSAYVLIGLFIVHLCIGPFRLYNPEWRMIQIALHWGVGWVEYSLALVVTLSASAIPSGMMNCVAFGVYCGFILFQIVMTVGMELHMRLVVDRELALDPPREYLPPPMMRLFHRDAPYSKCRIVMLILFVTGCFTFYGLMHTFIHLDGGETGCFQPKEEKPTSPV